MRPTIPKPLEWMHRAPVRAVRTRTVQATPDQVFAVLADHEAWPEWFDQITSVDVLGPAEGVGARRRVHIGSTSVDEEFLAWEPGRRFSFTVTQASRPGIRSLNEDIRLVPVGDDSTTVAYTMALDPVGPGRLLAPVLNRVVGKALDGALDGLATRLAR